MFVPDWRPDRSRETVHLGVVTVLVGLFFVMAAPVCVEFGCDFGGGLVIMGFGAFTTLFGGAFAAFAMRGVGQ